MCYYLVTDNSYLYYYVSLGESDISSPKKKRKRKGGRMADPGRINLINFSNTSFIGHQLYSSNL